MIKDSDAFMGEQAQQPGGAAAGDQDKISQFYFHTPEDVSLSYVAWAEELTQTEGLTWGVKSLDDTLLSLRPGNRLGIVARPGNAKSSLLAFLMQRAANKILAEGNPDECVYYVSWDQPVEETDAYFQAQGVYAPADMLEGKVDLKLVRKQAGQRLKFPIFHIGVSRRHRGFRRPPPPTMAQVVDMITDYRFSNGMIPKLIVLDYIQKVPGKNGYRSSDRTGDVTEAIFAASDMAMALDAPLAIGVQASRAVGARSQQIPTLEDAQWASALEQEVDRLIGLWMPIRSYDPQERPLVNIGGRDYENTERLLAIRNLKQRFGRGFGIWAVSFDIPTLRLGDLQQGNPKFKPFTVGPEDLDGFNF